MKKKCVVRKYLVTAAAVLLFLMQTIPAYAYFDRGTVSVSLGQSEVDLTSGDGANVTVSFSPSSSDQLPGCGMQRQAGIITAFSAGPEYLFLDEAFDGLDLGVRRMMRRMVRLYVRDRKACNRRCGTVRPAAGYRTPRQSPEVERSYQ